MKGRRNDATPDGYLKDFQEGDYGWSEKDGCWWARCPGARAGASLENHEVTENEDGTITCSPSLLIPGQYHGYLVNGEWSENTETRN